MKWALHIANRKQYVQTARAVALIGGSCATECRAILEKQLRLGEIDDESYRIRMEAVEVEAAAHVAGESLRTVDTSLAAGWVPLAGGGHMRMMRQTE